MYRQVGRQVDLDLGLDLDLEVVVYLLREYSHDL